LKSKIQKLDVKLIVAIVIGVFLLLLSGGIVLRDMVKQPYLQSRAENIEGIFPVHMSSAHISSRFQRELEDDALYIRAERISGRQTLIFDLEENVSTGFYIVNSNTEGYVTISIKKSDIEKIIDISGEFDDYINIDGFYGGRVEFVIRYNRAMGVKTVLQWSQ